MLKKIIRFTFVIVLITFAFSTFILQIIGIKNFVVISSSMNPAISKYSLVYVKSVNLDEIEIGDVIAVDIGKTPLMHRVIEINNDELTTHGDANSEGVNEIVNYNNVIGTVFFSIPFVGLLFLNTYIWIIIAIILVVVLFYKKQRK